MALLAFRQVSFTYPKAERPAVRDVSFQVENGDFVCICGATGSGKSTLLRLAKRELRPTGSMTGQILLDGVPLDELPPETAAFSVGYVMQRPDEQIVTDKVWHELAFGLENMGLSQSEMARRIAETAAYFGIEDWYERPVHTLSGGQKQLLNLAAVMAMQPKVLLLDEPTAQLDPIAAADFIATVHRLNRELGLTVLVVEHRLEEIVPLCDRMAVLEEGQLLAWDAPRQVIASLAGRKELLLGMPSAARLYHAIGEGGDCPLSLSEGRRMVEKRLAGCSAMNGAESANGLPDQSMPLPCAGSRPKGLEPAPALQLTNVFFRYERQSPDVLCGANLTVGQGEILCLLGGNGSGKSTLLSVAAGLQKAQHGWVEVLGRKIAAYPGQSLYRECVAMLPQDVQTVFLYDTVAEELQKGGGDTVALPFDFAPFMDSHPYDLSGGQQQMLALARVLAQKPRLLLMDEPTKGLDAHARQQLVSVLQGLKAQGISVLVVTHDVTFAAACADRCAMLFRGQVASEGKPADFFSRNLFYTTPISRMTRNLLPGCLTVEDAAQALGAQAQEVQGA